MALRLKQQAFLSVSLSCFCVVDDGPSLPLKSAVYPKHLRNLPVVHSYDTSYQSSYYFTGDIYNSWLLCHQIYGNRNLLTVHCAKILIAWDTNCPLRCFTDPLCFLTFSKDSIKGMQSYLLRLFNTPNNFSTTSLFWQAFVCSCLCLLLPRYRINIFPRHPQLPGPDAGWVGHLMGAHVCHCHVVPQEIPTSDVQEGSVCRPVWHCIKQNYL